MEPEDILNFIEGHEKHENEGTYIFFKLTCIIEGGPLHQEHGDFLCNGHTHWFVELQNLSV